MCCSVWQSASCVLQCLAVSLLCVTVFGSQSLCVAVFVSQPPVCCSVWQSASCVLQCLAVSLLCVTVFGSQSLCVAVFVSQPPVCCSVWQSAACPPGDAVGRPPHTAAARPLTQHPARRTRASRPGTGEALAVSLTVRIRSLWLVHCSAFSPAAHLTVTMSITR